MSDTEKVGWGSDRYTYTLEQLKYLDECFNLNRGKMSAVVGCALGNRRLFCHITTANDVEFLIGLIERREELINNAMNPGQMFVKSFQEK